MDAFRRWMRRESKTGLLILFLVLSFSGHAEGLRDSAAATRIPDVLTTAQNDAYFISAASMTVAGKLDWSAVPEITRVVLQSQIAGKRRQRVQTHAPAPGASAPCDVHTISPHNQESSRSWKQLVESSPAIYRGTIVATRPGFLVHSARPVQLLAVDITESLRIAPGFPERGIIYVPSSAVDMTLDGERFCDAGQHGFVPEPGDDILIFPMRGPVDAAGILIPTADERLIYSRNGALKLPALLDGDSTLPEPLTIDALRNSLQRAAARRQ